MAEGGGLLNRYTGKTVSGVRIPLSPPNLDKTQQNQGINRVQEVGAPAQPGATRGRYLPECALFWGKYLGKELGREVA